MSFAARISAKEGYTFRLIQGKEDSGEDFFAFVIFLNKGFDRYTKDFNLGKKIDLKKYGIIVKRGSGQATGHDIDVAMAIFREKHLKQEEYA